MKLLLTAASLFIFVPLASAQSYRPPSYTEQIAESTVEACEARLDQVDTTYFRICEEAGFQSFAHSDGCVCTSVSSSISPVSPPYPPTVYECTASVTAVCVDFTSPPSPVIEYPFSRNRPQSFF